MTDLPNEPLTPRMVAAMAAAHGAVERLLKVPVQEVIAPTAKRANSMRVRLANGGSVIATRRSDPRRADLEAHVLSILHQSGAPVPAVRAFDGTWLLQEDVGERSLRRAIRASDAVNGERWLGRGLRSLAAIHTAAAARDLASRVQAIGDGRQWHLNLAGTPARIGAALGLMPPAFDRRKLRAVLERPAVSFIKWDARPANGAAMDDGRVVWFDWEHCGARRRLDDMVWLLCDESVPNWPSAERRLIARWLSAFDEDGDPATAAAYLWAAGVMHSATRLALRLDSQRRRGVNPLALTSRDRRLCRRAARWASRSDVLAPLAAWFSALQDEDFVVRPLTSGNTISQPVASA